MKMKKMIKNNKTLLYKTQSKIERQKESNYGLYHNKFFNQWNEMLNDLDKNEWLKEIPEGGLGNEDLIKEYNLRQQKHIESKEGILINLQSISKLLIGFGNSHPVENSLTFHHTLGIPYIPGSSLKGAVKSFCLNYLNVENSLVNNIFGCSNNKSIGLGSIHFLDIIPSKKIQLVKDIMTPHYNQYYQSSKNIPGDWYAPNPIRFVAIKEQSRFQTGIIPKNSNAKENLEIVEKWMIETLETSGLGAKTSVGYGRFQKMK
jgi:CRISPR-associated protein Cmr6